MSLKATYNNQYLGVYVTGADLDTLIAKGDAYVPIFWGKDEMPGGNVWLALDQAAVLSLQGAVQAEREAIQAVRDEGPVIVPEPKKRGRKEVKEDAQEPAPAGGAAAADQDAGAEPGSGLQPAAE
jgi:hypothetical protein